MSLIMENGNTHTETTAEHLCTYLHRRIMFCYHNDKTSTCSFLSSAVLCRKLAFVLSVTFPVFSHFSYMSFALDRRAETSIFCCSRLFSSSCTTSSSAFLFSFSYSLLPPSIVPRMQCT